jgi:copper/silver efflux system protein
MTVCAVLASLIPILWASGIGSDVMKPMAAPMVGGMITSTMHVLILVPVFFVLMKQRALRRGTLQPTEAVNTDWPGPRSPTRHWMAG